MLLHLTGAFLFLFIPFVLFLFLRFPFGILSSFALAILLMLSHRFVAVPFMQRNKQSRCLWCGRTSRPRDAVVIHAASGQLPFECCKENCYSKTKRFCDFCSRNRIWIRAGIFLPLLWYIVTMLLYGFDVWKFPIEWNRFIFQFFIACTVVTISLLYALGKESDAPSLPFPIHNLFLLGIRNTLLIFRLVGVWWISVGLYFLWKQLSY
jgi:hypothetical protein